MNVHYCFHYWRENKQYAQQIYFIGDHTTQHQLFLQPKSSRHIYICIYIIKWHSQVCRLITFTISKQYTIQPISCICFKMAWKGLINCAVRVPIKTTRYLINVCILTNFASRLINFTIIAVKFVEVHTFIK